MKTLFSIILLGVVAFCAIKIVPVFTENFELQDYINHVAEQASAQSPVVKPEVIQSQIMAKAESLGIPLERRDITVSVRRNLQIRIDYSVYVNLRLYMLTLHFAPSAQNRSVV